MKVGIVTFHRAENFGAVMQAYALQQFLRSEGCQVDIIDYRNKIIEAMYQIYNPYILFTRKNIFKSLYAYMSRFRSLADRRICKDKYAAFRSEYLNVTPKRFYKLGQAASNFDCIIAGSDQIWNLHLTGGLDKNYFLGYEKGAGMKKIAYAASSEFSKKDLIADNKLEINRLLDDFNNISVREDFLKEELDKYTKKNIDVCLDPTFLLDASFYKQLAVKPIEGKYILVYHMTPVPKASIIAERIAKENGWNVVEIHIGYGIGKTDERHKMNLGPIEILSYIVYAEEVLTSSFHGLALSLIMKKNVWVINKDNNLRQRNLLSSLGLNNHLLDGDDFDDEKIDYTRVNVKLDLQIAKSKDFLRCSLFGENEKDSVLS